MRRFVLKKNDTHILVPNIRSKYNIVPYVALIYVNYIKLYLRDLFCVRCFISFPFTCCVITIQQFCSRLIIRASKICCMICN